MIPPLNPHGKGEYLTDSYICDCCCSETVPYINGFGTTINRAIAVPVGGVSYLACSRECARILFHIHHQYAMREAK